MNHHCVTLRVLYALLRNNIYKHVGFYKNIREVLRKHESQANASVALLDVLKNLKCLNNSIMYVEEVFLIFFYKMYCELRALVLMTEAACIISKQ